MASRRPPRLAVAASLLALVVATAVTVGVAPRPAYAANAYNILIADNYGKRLVITDPWGKIKWEFKNPLNQSSQYAGPLGAKWLPGNKILATFGTGTVGLIDAATKTFDWKFYGCSNSNWLQSPYDAELLPDGNLAIATRYNEGGRVAVFNRQGCQIVWKYLLSNAHSVRLYDPGYGSSGPTLLMGGWGKTAEATYGGAWTTPQVTWSYATEYTHDAMVVRDGNIITVEGYYIQKLTRSKSRLWKVMTPDEERRVAINPDGGYIFSVADADRIEFRDENGALQRTFSYLSDGSKLDLPYAVQVVYWPDLGGGSSPTPTPTPTPAASPTPTPTPTASGTSGGTLVSDGFESGSFAGWTVGRGGDGTAAVQSGVVRSGSYAAKFAATSSGGSYGYARRWLPSATSQVTVKADVRVDQEGASGGNVPLMRLFDGSGTRMLQLYRQNATGGQLWLQYGGNWWSTGASLPLGSWSWIELGVVVNGSSSTVTVRKDGATIYSTSAASLGWNGVAAFQFGNDTASQTFTSYADNVTVTSP